METHPTYPNVRMAKPTKPWDVYVLAGIGFTVLVAWVLGQVLTAETPPPLAAWGFVTAVLAVFATVLFAGVREHQREVARYDDVAATVSRLAEATSPDFAVPDQVFGTGDEERAVLVNTETREVALLQNGRAFAYHAADVDLDVRRIQGKFFVASLHGPGALLGGVPVPNPGGTAVRDFVETVARAKGEPTRAKTEKVVDLDRARAA